MLRKQRRVVLIGIRMGSLVGIDRIINERSKGESPKEVISCEMDSEIKLFRSHSCTQRATESRRMFVEESRRTSTCRIAEETICNKASKENRGGSRTTEGNALI